MGTLLKYENVAVIYARLIKEGKRTLSDIQNADVRKRVGEILGTPIPETSVPVAAAPDPIEPALVDARIELASIKAWFSEFYSPHIEKYNRLIDMNVTCDDGTSAALAKSNLYVEAEAKRARIQELEAVIASLG